MAQAFMLKSEKEGRSAPSSSGGKPKLAVTGAAGRIGSSFCEANRANFRLVLIDHPDVPVPDDLKKTGEVRTTDISDPKGIEDALSGCDLLLHLAADPSPSADWEVLLKDNIEGTYNVLNSAQKAGIRRIVYASSIHAVSGYEEGYQVHPGDPVNPGDLYGVTKCFGESMGRYLAVQKNIDFIAVRIGSFSPLSAAYKPETVSIMNSFVSDRDLNQLFRLALLDTQVRFAIVHGLSRNRFNRMSLVMEKELFGYEPQDDFTELNPALEDLKLQERVTPHDEQNRG